MRIDSAVSSNASITGSFSGSFTGVGNFVGLTADSVEYANVANKPTLVSGSSQISYSGITDIPGGIVSSSTQIDNLFNLDGILSGSSLYSNAQGEVELTTNGVAQSAVDLGLQTSDSPTFAGLTVNGAITVTGNVDGRDIATDGAKLDGIEASADVTDTANVTAAGALMDSELTDLAGIKALTVSSKQDVLAEGAFVDGDKTKLDGIESGATGDMSDAEIKTAYENNSNTNAFTDALLSKLNGIEASADVTDTANVTAAGALMDSEVDADIKTLSLPANTTISAFGKTLVDDADASAARTTLGVDAAGTDNSTDVTLVTTSHNYLSLSGQAITLGEIDISDDTNLAVSDTTGQTGINLTLSGDTLSGVVSGLTTTSNVTFANLTVSGDLTVDGTTTSINSTNLDVTDKLIAVNRGGTTAASADGGGLFISGANESLTWDNGNSRFNFSDDVHAAGNITLTGTVDGRDVAADGTKLDGIAASANNYVHPTHPGDDFSVDTGALTGATVVSDIDINVTTDTLGHVTDANGTVSTRTLTLADLGYTGTTDANTYVHPTHPGDDFSVDTGALTGATVVSDIDINVTTDALGHVTDANGSVATRTLTLADLGYTGTTDANTYAITNDNTSNVHFEGLMVGQTTGATANTIRCVGDVVAYYSSDAQFKDNVETLEGALDKVKQIRGVRFDWNDKQDVYTGHDIGVIAQEVQAVYPELVHHRDHSDSLAVDYVKLTAVLIEAVKELSAKVAELEKK